MRLKTADKRRNLHFFIKIVQNKWSLTKRFQSFGEDFSDEPNASPFDLFEEMENVDTEETQSDPFFETGFYFGVTQKKKR